VAPANLRHRHHHHDENSPGHTIYVVLQGSVKIYTENNQGQEVILGLRGPGEVLGEVSLIDNLSRSANIVTLEKCVMLSADRAQVQQCLLEMPAILLNLSRILASRLRTSWRANPSTGNARCEGDD
jgi:CRP/FNR family cyclic AMP-dependent transcriptional regulator